LVVNQSNVKKRLCVDYSVTINRYTYLDAYPLPRIDEVINKVAQDTFYSSLDLKSAYHQVSLALEKRSMTAFEADGRRFQYCRLLFGVTNGVFAFQRVMENFIKRHKLKKVYAYLDDLTVTGATKEEHQKNLQRLLEAAKTDGLTLNESKSKICVKSLDLLGYRVSYGKMQPDPSSLQPLLTLQPPSSPKELTGLTGLFAYYAKWIKDFSKKDRPLQSTSKFPLGNEALESFKTLKSDLIHASLGVIRDDLPFEVETDASDYAIAAILSHGGRSVAYMSRSLNKCEQKYSAVEKEASAIIEATRKWSQFLKGRHFTLVTGQRSVAFMFDQKNRGKITNTKIMVWRPELGQLNYSIRNRPGKDNVAPDAMSRICSSMSSVSQLRLLHDQLWHPGFARMYHLSREELLQAALLRITQPETANARELTRPSGKQLSYCCIAVHAQRRGGRTFSMKHCILCEPFSALPPMRLLMNKCFDFGEKRRLATQCRLGSYAKVQCCCVVMFIAKVTHFVMKCYCWRQTLCMCT